jgi:hypothetical protein
MMLEVLLLGFLGAVILSGEKKPSKEGFGILPPGTSSSARMNQNFQAALLASPGSQSRSNALQGAAANAYAIRLAGGDPGEMGFAAIRASRPRVVGGSQGAISRAWGTSWPYDDLESGLRDDGAQSIAESTDDIADIVAESFGKNILP